uniref:Uncharacterized protein n=1 Tax=Oryza sativa subsp. japonica TaxID=39947 RepID=Q94HQ2_ORYSJ|nr:Hypothetical protein [Oryza sativa Japonica Group]
MWSGDTDLTAPRRIRTPAAGSRQPERVVDSDGGSGGSVTVEVVRSVTAMEAVANGGPAAGEGGEGVGHGDSTGTGTRRRRCEGEAVAGVESVGREGGETGGGG